MAKTKPISCEPKSRKKTKNILERKSYEEAYKTEPTSGYMYVPMA
jgi:hypothetical protein